MSFEKFIPTPLLRWSSKLSYFIKGLLILLLLSIALLTAFFKWYSLQSTQIQNINYELQSVNYLRHLRNLMELLPKHQTLIFRFLDGETSLKSEILRLHTQINNEFKKFEDDENSESINFSAMLKFEDERGYQILNTKDLAKKWATLARDAFEINRETNLLLHEQILDQQKSIIAALNDRANFYRNTSVNYLLDISTRNLPTIQQLIPLIAFDSDKIAANESSTLTDMAHLIGSLALLRSQTNAVISHMQEALYLSKTVDLHPQTEYKLKESSDQFENSIKAFIGFIDENIIPHSSMANKNNNELLPLAAKALSATFALNDNSIEQIEFLLNQKLQVLQKNKLFISSIIIGSFLSALALLLLTLIQFIYPTKQLVSFLNRFRHGDISSRATIYFDDEIGSATRNLNEVSTIVEGIITQLQRTGIQLMTSTTQIAAAAKEQEVTVIQQEATTKEIGVTASEISTTAKNFAHTMNNISQSAEQTSQLATSGRESLTQMEAFMRQMVEASTNIASRLGVLSEKASTITGVITTISNVANQTNLLSLNAAIEAEKAGEHGRSFAVIAREIRRLSDQTSNATLDIEKMVNEMVTAVSQGVMGVDKFTEEIRTGVSQVSTVSSQLAKIIEQVQIQTVSFENVNQGMQNQSLGAEQINEAIGQLTEVAQQTSESIHQFHNAIEQLKNVAKEMQTATNVLKN